MSKGGGCLPVAARDHGPHDCDDSAGRRCERAAAGCWSAAHRWTGHGCVRQKGRKDLQAGATRPRVRPRSDTRLSFSPSWGMSYVLSPPKMRSERVESKAMTTSVPFREVRWRVDDETDSICSRLVRETGCGEAEVRIAVGRALEQFRGAPVREFVMLLAERDARRQLRASQIDQVRTTGSDARDAREMTEGGRNGQGDR